MPTNTPYRALEPQRKTHIAPCMGPGFLTQMQLVEFILKTDLDPKTKPKKRKEEKDNRRTTAQCKHTNANLEMLRIRYIANL